MHFFKNNNLHVLFFLCPLLCAHLNLEKFMFLGKIKDFYDTANFFLVRIYSIILRQMYHGTT